jgi:hypothetical protein
VSSSGIDTGVPSPEDELVRAELDNAHRKRRTGRGRIVGIVVSVPVVGGADSRRRLSHYHVGRTVSHARNAVRPETAP